MASSAAGTVVGALRATVVRRLPLLTPMSSVLWIHGHVWIDCPFPTTGQPCAAEMERTRIAGYSGVLNRVHERHAQELARRGSGGF